MTGPSIAERHAAAWGKRFLNAASSRTSLLGLFPGSAAAGVHVPGDAAARTALRAG